MKWFLRIQRYLDTPLNEVQGIYGKFQFDMIQQIAENHINACKTFSLDYTIETCASSV